MKMIRFIGFATFVFTFSISCNNGPKEIAPVQQDSNSQRSGIFDNNDNSQIKEGGEVVRIEVLEVLPTDKYVYLRVNNNVEEYWIATRKSDVNVGDKFFYSDALLKTNFESKEFNRIFDKIYLVNKIVPINHGESQKPTEERESSNAVKVQKPIVVEGSLTIAEIVSNPEKYNGQEIQVSGRCTKVNAKIMGTNWVHLDDGSKSDYDFVMTTNEIIPVGHTITAKGILATKKDFGAGYFYEIILENCELVK